MQICPAFLTGRTWRASCSDSSSAARYAFVNALHLGVLATKPTLSATVCAWPQHEAALIVAGPNNSEGLCDLAK